MLLGEAGEEAEGVSGLLLPAVFDFALRQHLLQFINLRLGEVGAPPRMWELLFSS